MAPVMYMGLQPGGQLTITNDVENFPGYPDGVMGPEMMEDLKKAGRPLRYRHPLRHCHEGGLFGPSAHKITIDETTELTADAVIIATGASAKWLGLPSEAKLNGSGVSACAVCDGFFYRGPGSGHCGGWRYGRGGSHLPGQPGQQGDHDCSQRRD